MSPVKYLCLVISLHAQLGLGAATVRFAPTYNSLLCGGGGGVVSVGAGANHSACVLANGRVFSWGHAEYNQQGIAGVSPTCVRSKLAPMLL